MNKYIIIYSSDPNTSGNSVVTIANFDQSSMTIEPYTEYWREILESIGHNLIGVYQIDRLTIGI